MTYGKSFYAVAAICSLASAFTTLVLIFGPDFHPEPVTLEDRIALLSHPAFRLRMWVYYVHPFITFIAALGAYTIAKRFNPGFALLGIVFFGLWAANEALQQALNIVALNWTWRGAYAAADAATQALYRAHMDMFAALWDGLFFLLNTAFLLGNLFFAFALARGRAFDRLIAFVYLAGAMLAVLAFVEGYGGPPWLAAISAIAYPAIQPLARALIGLWIWRRGPQPGPDAVAAASTTPP